MDNCPKCGCPTLNAPGIGPYCPNAGCDVADNLLQVEAPTLPPLQHCQTCTCFQADGD